MILTCIKLYALASLLFTALYAWAGFRWQKRKALREAKAESRWWLSRCVEHEIEPIQPIIRTWQ